MAAAPVEAVAAAELAALRSELALDARELESEAISEERDPVAVAASLVKLATAEEIWPSIEETAD